jgi:N-acetylmuramoyl-L-alanine amidase CwlA
VSDQAPAGQPHRIIDDAANVETAREKEENQAAAELSAPSKNGVPSMDVKVHSPFKNYYEGEAFSVSGENETGAFDILPTHHNFITLLSPCELIIRSPQGDQKIQISGGIMHVKADKVIVFLDV